MQAEIEGWDVETEDAPNMEAVLLVAVFVPMSLVNLKNEKQECVSKTEEMRRQITYNVAPGFAFAGQYFVNTCILIDGDVVVVYHFRTLPGIKTCCIYVVQGPVAFRICFLYGCFAHRDVTFCYFQDVV